MALDLRVGGRYSDGERVFVITEVEKCPDGRQFAHYAPEGHIRPGILIGCSYPGYEPWGFLEEVQ